MKTIDTYNVGQDLFRGVAKLIDETRKSVAYTINSALTYMYWKNVPQGQHFINRRFKPTEKTRYTLCKVPQGRHLVLKVSSLRDFGVRSFCLLRRFKPTVNKVLSLRDYTTNKQVRNFAIGTTIDINFPIVASLMRQSKIKNQKSKILHGNQISI